ncbi:hypothetical protein [Bacillus sp. P14.5]|uniref:hypothetical protein n=1 Tax=Bacillus sp. P14.5 TaxID=1983400 RepID=UPI000DE92DD8|nr:hypothetical protein [Bacillus sp. P14.5]
MNRDPLKNLKAELDEEVFHKQKLKSRKDAILKEAREGMTNSQKKRPKWAPVIAALAIPLIGFLLIGPVLLEQFPRLLDTNPEEVTEPSKKKIEETPKASEIKKVYSSLWEQERLNFRAMYLLADFKVDGKEYSIDTGVEYRSDGIPSINQQNTNNDSRVILEDNLLYYKEIDKPATVTAIPAPSAYLKADHEPIIMSYPYYPAKLPEDIASNQYTWKIIEEGEHGIIVSGLTDNKKLSLKEFKAKIHPETGILLSFEGKNQKGDKAIEWKDRKFHYNEVSLGISDSNQMFLQYEMSRDQNLTPILKELLSGENDEWKNVISSIGLDTSNEVAPINVNVKLNRKISRKEEEQTARKIAVALQNNNESPIAQYVDFEINFYNPEAEKAYRKAYSNSILQQNEDRYDEDGNPKMEWIDIK